MADFSICSAGTVARQVQGFPPHACQQSLGMMSCPERDEFPEAPPCQPCPGTPSPGVVSPPSGHKARLEMTRIYKHWHIITKSRNVHLYLLVYNCGSWELCQSSGVYWWCQVVSPSPPRLSFRWRAAAFAGRLLRWAGEPLRLWAAPSTRCRVSQTESQTARRGQRTADPPPRSYQTGQP